MGGSARRKANHGIPEDLVMEILIRLPGKQVGRCKCVCKPWRSMITSAHFKDAYGTRHLFDFSKEKFHKISVPHQFVFNVMYSSIEGFVRAEFMEGQQRLAVSLWTISRRRWSAKKRMVCKLLECFVMEDVEGESWTEHFIDFPLQLVDGDKEEVFFVSNGSLSATSGTEMVVINSAANEVYCYEHNNTSKMQQFRVGKQPDYTITTYGQRPPAPSYYAGYSSTLSCLYDANHLYLPLDDILSASK